MFLQKSTCEITKTSQIADTLFAKNLFFCSRETPLSSVFFLSTKFSPPIGGEVERKKTRGVWKKILSTKNFVELSEYQNVLFKYQSILFFTCFFALTFAATEAAHQFSSCKKNTTLHRTDGNHKFVCNFLILITLVYHLERNALFVGKSRYCSFNILIMQIMICTNRTHSAFGIENRNQIFALYQTAFSLATAVVVDKCVFHYRKQPCFDVGVLVKRLFVKECLQKRFLHQVVCFFFVVGERKSKTHTKTDKATKNFRKKGI